MVIIKMNKSYIQNIMNKLTPRQKLKYGNQINYPILPLYIA